MFSSGFQQAQISSRSMSRTTDSQSWLQKIPASD
jgi:hypothetical protein